MDELRKIDHDKLCEAVEQYALWIDNCILEFEKCGDEHLNAAHTMKKCREYLEAYLAIAAGKSFLDSR